MIQLMLYTLTITSSIIFLQMNHPLAMGLLLLIQTLLISLITGTMAKSFWFSYIIFLIFLGGMLVLFIYVTSLASNEMFSLSMKLTMMSALAIMMMLLIIFTNDSLVLTLTSTNNEMNPVTHMNSFLPENSMSLTKLYNYPTNMITILLMNYLLITLIAIVKITNVHQGPLRPHH